MNLLSYIIISFIRFFTDREKFTQIEKTGIDNENPMFDEFGNPVYRETPLVGYQ
jgi:hypothetical protein